MGKPSRGNARLPSSEYIARWRHTRGTETSKYPEEKKTKVIPSVAASESGKAQTKELALWGCGTSHMESKKKTLGEEDWKVPSQKVRTL